jgi:hypothetical protein
VSPAAHEGRLGPALLIALLAATLAAGVLVYHERTANLALEVPKLDRILGTGPRGETRVEIEFFVRFDEPNATVLIAGLKDAPVRTFGEGVPLADGERIECAWDGIDDDGEPAPPGSYRLRVVLPEHDRDLVFPQRIKVTPSFEPTEEDAGCRRKAGGEPLS